MRGIKIGVEQGERARQIGRGRRIGQGGGQQYRLGLIDQAVVLGVEDGVDGGEANVLVGTAVTGDVVRIEQLVVVEARCGWRIRRVDDVVRIGQQRIAEGIEWIGRGGNVNQELVARAHGKVRAGGVVEVDRRQRVAF